MTVPLTTVVAALVVIVAAPSIAQNPTPYISISAIGSQPRALASAVTVRVTLTLTGNPAYIQDLTGGAEVDGPYLENLKIGDQLLVTGHAEFTDAGLALRPSKAVLLWHGSPVPPLSVTADEAALGKFAALLIEVNGRLVDTERHHGETWLRLESGHQVFLVRLKAEQGSSILPIMENGSTLRVRGVCSLQPQDTLYQGGFALLLRSAEDVTVIAGPPWWSLGHLTELGFLLACLVIAGHVTLVQILKARFRAIMAERAKLGHELHDTLAQSFAGVSYQIQAARRLVGPANGLLTKHLDIALDMVRHSHAEAHRSIMMLRPQHLSDSADLPSAIQAALEQSTAGCQLNAGFAIRGLATHLPLVTTDTLYRIAQESIANALRHGHPTTLEVSLEYAPSSVTLSVIDDGAGFDARATQGHGFGLAGMRERVRALRGDFTVLSEPGHGTQIRAEIHLRQNLGTRILIASRAKASACWDRFRHVLCSRTREIL
jgi:signal transduction histidine kinase